jgi:hypothetical protein
MSVTANDRQKHLPVGKKRHQRCGAAREHGAERYQKEANEQMTDTHR